MLQYECLVAAGGYGERLGLGRPKSLIDFNGATLLKLHLTQLRLAGFRKILVANNNSQWSNLIQEVIKSFDGIGFIEDIGYPSTFLLCKSLADHLDTDFLFTYGHAPRSVDLYSQFRSRLGVRIASGVVQTSSKRKPIFHKGIYFEPPFVLRRSDLQISTHKEWNSFFRFLPSAPEQIFLSGPSEFNDRMELENFFNYLNFQSSNFIGPRCLAH